MLHKVLLAIVLGQFIPVDASDAQAVTTVANSNVLAGLDITLIHASMVLVAGYSHPGDGGGGIFLWQPDSRQVPDGIVTILPKQSVDVSTPGRWHREWWNGRLSPEAAGAEGDGTTNDEPAFARLVAISHSVGAFTITLSPGRRYFMATMLDLSLGAPGLVLSGPASPHFAGNADTLPTRVELNPLNGATVKLGTSQVLRDVLVWRHGLRDVPGGLTDVRSEVALWYSEDGGAKPRSIGVFAPFPDTTVEGCMVIGFHTGIAASGERFKVRHSLIDAAGYAMDVTHSADTSLIEDVQTRAFWSLPVGGSDAFGDHSYRPGTAFYIHGRSDGLQVNSVMAIGWVTGIWLKGEPGNDDWLISILQPDIETPPNAGAMTSAIKTSGGVRRLTIVDPRVVAGGSGPSAALDFVQWSANPAAAANNNVTVIGGTLEVASHDGNAVLIGPGATGSLIGVTMAYSRGDERGIFVRVLEGAGRWSIVNPTVGGRALSAWLSTEGNTRSLVTVTPSPAP